MQLTSPLPLLLTLTALFTASLSAPVAAPVAFADLVARVFGGYCDCKCQAPKAHPPYDPSECDKDAPGYANEQIGW